ncbi:MAG: hypothetical protein AAF481_19950 [Acidobacteriota bacterium]
MGAPWTVRACASLLGALWTAVAAFWLLSVVRGFSVPGALVLALTLLLWLRRTNRDGRLGADLSADLRAALRAFRDLPRRPEGWLWLAVAALAGVRCLRALASPPLAWDSLTYHLFKAGRFVQSGGWVAESAPDAWGAYEYLSPLGDVLSAWALLGTQRDGLLPLLEFGLWLTAQFAVYTAARQLGGARRGALLASAAIGACPAAVAYIGSGYVDLAALTFAALGSVFVLRWLVRDGEEPGVAVWSAAAAGLVAGVKMTAVPLALLMVSALIAGGWRGRRRRAAEGQRRWGGRHTWGTIAAAGIGLAVGAPPFLRAWIERGSPVYPFPLDVAGIRLLPGHPAAESGAVFGKPLEGFWELWSVLLFRSVKDAFVNPGFLLPVAALLAMWGVVAAWRHVAPGGRWAMVYCWISGVALLAWFTVDATASFRTTQAAVTSGRYLLPYLATLAMAGALLRQRAAHFAWGALVVSGLWLARPRAWTPVEAAPLAGVAALTLAVAALLAVVAVRRRTRSAAIVVVTAVLIGALATAGLEALRAPHRYALWEASADLEDPLFHVHRLHSAYASAWPLWRALDGETGRRIAVTAGWDGLGHNWYRYPLLGSRLQNRLFYIPVTANGEVVDYRQGEALERRADFDAWLERLRAAEIELVVSLMPRWTPEDAWMRGAPEVFEPLGGDERNFHAVFALDSAAATMRLRSEALPRQR